MVSSFAFVEAEVAVGGVPAAPQEASICVFGDELLAHVDQELTDLLGTVLRRGGRPVGNVWSFGP